MVLGWPLDDVDLDCNGRKNRGNEPLGACYRTQRRVFQGGDNQDVVQLHVVQMHDESMR